MNKLNRLTSKITAVMSLSVIVGLGGMTIFGNKNGKSFSENRELTKFTKPSFETVYDGRSAEQLDGYFTDHFTDRSKWLYFKSLIEAEVSESIVNGVYVSSERLLDTENTHLNEKMLSYNADIINNFAKKYDGTAYFVAVPSSIFSKDLRNTVGISSLIISELHIVSGNAFTASKAGFILSPPNGSKPVIKTFIFISNISNNLRS